MNSEQPPYWVVRNGTGFITLRNVPVPVFKEGEEGVCREVVISMYFFFGPK